MLLSIPELIPELQEHIFNYLHICDAKNLACCNSDHNEKLKRLLWRTITIPWKHLYKKTFTSNKEIKLRNLRFTKNLRFVAYAAIKDEKDLKDNLTFIDNYKEVLTACDSAVLHGLSITGVPMYESAISIAFETLKNIRSISLLRVQMPTDAGFQSMRNLTNLEHCDLSSTCVSDSTLVVLSASNLKIKTLNLRKTKITDDGLKDIAKLISLRKLDLGSCKITDAGAPELSNLSKLQELSLASSEISDDGLHGLSGLTCLEKLDLTSCIKVADTTMTHLMTFPSLTELKVGFCQSVTDAGIEKLSQLKNLRNLDISSTSITDGSLSDISKHLELKCIDISSTSITDVGLKYLSTLKSLLTLRASRTEISNEGIKFFALSHLRELDISYCSIDDAAISYACQISSLRVTDISGSKITDASFQLLSMLPELRELVCCDTDITDNAIQYLCSCPSLQHLNVSETKVTDACGEHLRRLRLNVLHLRGTNISDNFLTSVGQFTCLSSLALSNTKVSNEGIGNLKSLQRLRELESTDTGITNEGLASLKCIVQESESFDFEVSEEKSRQKWWIQWLLAVANFFLLIGAWVPIFDWKSSTPEKYSTVIKYETSFFIFTSGTPWLQHFVYYMVWSICQLKKYKRLNWPRIFLVHCSIWTILIFVSSTILVTKTNFFNCSYWHCNKLQTSVAFGYLTTIGLILQALSHHRSIKTSSLRVVTSSTIHHDPTPFPAEVDLEMNGTEGEIYRSRRKEIHGI